MSSPAALRRVGQGSALEWVSAARCRGCLLRPGCFAFLWRFTYIKQRAVVSPAQSSRARFGLGLGLGRTGWRARLIRAAAPAAALARWRLPMVEVYRLRRWCFVLLRRCRARVCWRSLPFRPSRKRRVQTWQVRARRWRWTGSPC